MKIHGIQKTTLLDYPGHVAATLFTGGCNFRCPFCHNADLVLMPNAYPVMSSVEVEQFLKKRQGLLDGICITGGEPTLQPDLEAFIRNVKEMGYLIKLDTNGCRPEVLQNLLEEGLLDYVAMDIKASKDNYVKAIGLTGDNCRGDFLVEQIEKSVELLMGSGISYEFRTTVVKGIHGIEEFEAIGEWIAGSKAYYLQEFTENNNLLADRLGREEGKFSGFSKEEMEQIRLLVKKYVDNVFIRGMD